MATKFEQRPKFVMFQKELFCNLASRTNLILKTIPIAGWQYFWKGFRFILHKADHFWSFCPFLKKQKLNEKFSDNLQQNICRLFNVLAQFLFAKSEMELDSYHQKVNVWVVSPFSEQLKTKHLRIKLYILDLQSGNN